MPLNHRIVFTTFILIAFLNESVLAQVKIYEEKEVIPTYKRGKDETSPIFYTGRSVQGASGKIYPYPSQAYLGSELVDVTYNMVVLENEYLKVKVLPAFGGRLFSAIDKTNGHELFHTNSVIKPDLIGTLGAWVSGGIEWCFPHHHRTTTMLPSDYRTVENTDGSATIWIGETEKTMDMRGVVGMTLHPGKSYIDVDYKISNTSTQTQTFLFWANVAVTANEDFRTFWPPSQEIGVFHNNNSFIQWPLSNKTEDYGRTSYDEGVDLTWWKNHPNPVSFFMWDIEEGFIGGYDYGAKAGMVHVGDPIENNASKLWQFGPGLQGQNARRKLTDDGKAYVELMTGTFSNNQPDYSWILPHSVKDAQNYWYPIRDLEIVKNATKEAAVTLQLRNPKTIFYGFNTTASYQNARLKLSYGDEILVEKRITIDPETPFTDTYKSRRVLDEYELYISLLDAQGKELVSYRPYKAKNPELPDPQPKVKKPEELTSVEDLYLTGRFVEQFKRPGLNADDYYLAALKKAPNDYRVNLALGMRRVYQTRYKEALEHLNTAANRLKVKYYQPKEGELFYYRGLAYRALGQMDEAYANLGRATWYYPWFSAANFQLAQMEALSKNYTKALEYIIEAYSTNTRDPRITILYSALLRKVKKNEEAKIIIDELLSYDPLNFTALYEKNLLNGRVSMEDWYKNMQDVDNNHLEVVTHYMNAGLLDEGISLLTSSGKSENPLLDYYLAWFYAQKGDVEKALRHSKSASTKSLEYVFPYRSETEKVMRKAIELNPEDGVAHYLLGNLLYDKRPKEAMKSWQRAAEVDGSMAMVWRNMAFAAFYHQKEPKQAIEYLNKAISLDNSYPLWYSELSKYYDASEEDFANNLAVLRKNLDVVKKDVAAPKTYVELLNLNGEFDTAIDFLDTHHFRTWEGGRSIYWRYVDAHTLKAIELIKAKKYTDAISHLNKALEYPENLEVGKPTHDEKNAMIFYYMGLAHQEMGNGNKAKVYFEKSTQAKNGPRMQDLLFFQGKAWQQIGDYDKANELFRTLIAKGEALSQSGSQNTLIAVEEASIGNKKQVSMAFYLKALGHLGLGDKEKSATLFVKATAENGNNLWAKRMADSL